MKRLIIILIAIFLLSGKCFSQEVVLSWDANTEADLSGYKIYYGETSGNYNTVVDVGDTTSQTLNVTEGKIYYFVLTAYDTVRNESVFSNEVNVKIPIIDTTPPDAPMGLEIVITIRVNSIHIKNEDEN